MTMQSTMDLLRAHRSCREWDPRPVPDRILETLVRAAQQAPTDATGQLYSLLHVADRTLQRRVADLIGGQAFVQDAPILLIVLVDTRRLAALLESRGEKLGIQSMATLLFGITDASLLAQSLVIAAESEGLGTCYLGSVQNNARALVPLLGLPRGVAPLYGLVLGYPKGRETPKPRLATRAILHRDHYRDLDGPALAACYADMAPATRSGDWVNPIRKYFATDGVMAQREHDLWRLFVEQGILDPTHAPPPR